VSSKLDLELIYNWGAR